jgi:hypothetical protein
MQFWWPFKHVLDTLQFKILYSFKIHSSLSWPIKAINTISEPTSKKFAQKTAIKYINSNWGCKYFESVQYIYTGSNFTAFHNTITGKNPKFGHNTGFQLTSPTHFTHPQSNLWVHVTDEWTFFLYKIWGFPFYLEDGGDSSSETSANIPGDCFLHFLVH